MKYLLIPLLCLLATTKITLQSWFSKGKHSDISDNILFNFIMFLTVALLLFPSVLENGATLSTCISGFIMGALSVAFQFFYVCALKHGKVVLTVMINNFSMVVPMGVSLVLFDEKFGILKIIGTVLVFASFVLGAIKGNDNGKGEITNGSYFKWFCFVTLVFLCNGFISVNQKVYSVFTQKLQVFEFVAVAYITATVLSLLILVVITFKNKTNTLKQQPKSVVCGCLSGIILGIFQCINTYAASIIDGTILYSTYNCGVALLSALAGRIVFKEKLSVKQYASILIGVIAIVFLCM